MTRTVVLFAWIPVLFAGTAGAADRWTRGSGGALVAQFEQQRALMQDDSQSDAARAAAKYWIAEHRADLGDYADWLDHRAHVEKVESALLGAGAGGFIAGAIFCSPTMVGTIALGAAAGTALTFARNASDRGNADRAQAAGIRAELGDGLDRMLALEDAREDIARVEADLPRVSAELDAIERRMGTNASRHAATGGRTAALPPSSSPATQNAGMHH